MSEGKILNIENINIKKDILSQNSFLYFSSIINSNNFSWYFLADSANGNKVINTINYSWEHLLFKDGKINKLSCVLQLNEGVNIPGLKQGIIMHAYGNERKDSQRIGRLLRLNPDDKAIVHILCYIGTVDEKWVKEALEDFDQSKIVWRNYNLQTI